MAARLIDTHCHLFLMEGEPRDLVEAAQADGVRALVCVGIDSESSRRSRELADSLSGVFATAGVHPHAAAGFATQGGAELEELLADPRVVAIGETGLDYFRMLSPREDQLRVFRVHCGLARETGKPLVVHCRDAWEDVLDVLGEEQAGQVVLHCFSGSVEIAREVATRGYYCSFAANITYPKNAHLLDAAREVPADRLLVETDSPYLAPQRVRGSENTPANVADVVEAVAAARGETPADVGATTSVNALSAFGLPSD